MNELFNNFIENDRNKKIYVAVIGDCLLDEDYEVSVDRVSPEFPIPVIKSKNKSPTTIKPGGAANVAYQITRCNADVDLFCFLDLEAANIFKDFAGFSAKAVLLKENKIPRKGRYYDKGFPVYRHDIEVSDYGSIELRNMLFNLILP